MPASSVNHLRTSKPNALNHRLIQHQCAAHCLHRLTSRYRTSADKQERTNSSSLQVSLTTQPGSWTTIDLFDRRPRLDHLSHHIWFRVVAFEMWVAFATVIVHFIRLVETAVFNNEHDRRGAGFRCCDSRV